jgi:tetratricopeptide (TPR) repeat protein
LESACFKNQAVAFKELGDIEKSIDMFNSAFSISPEDEHILKPYLGLLEEQGKYNEYLNLSRRLIDMNPADFSHYRVYIAALIRKRAYGEAHEWIERAKGLAKTQFDDAVLKQYEKKVLAAATIPPADAALAGEPTSVALRSTVSGDG